MYFKSILQFFKYFYVGWSMLGKESKKKSQKHHAQEGYVTLVAGGNVDLAGVTLM